MEKRLIAALALSIIFFVAYDKYVFQTYSSTDEVGTVIESEVVTQTETQPTVGTQQVTEKTTISNETPIVAADHGVSLKSVGANNLITVDSPLYTVNFSTRGASIRNYYMKGYELTNDAGITDTLDLIKHDAKEYPLALTFPDPALSYLKDVKFSVNKTKVDLVGKDQDDLIFVYEDEKVKVVKKLTFHKNDYIIDYSVDVLPKITADKSFIVSIGPGLEGEKQSYDMFDYDRIITFIDETKSTFDPDDITKEERVRGNINWVSVCNKYFASVLVPITPPASIVSNIDTTNELLISGFEYNSGATVTGRAYFGPQLSGEMEKISPDMEYIKDYGIFSFLAMPLYKVLNYVHGYVGNWGWAIIIVTIIIKILFYPLTRSSFRSMAKMRELSPQLKILQERYKDDRQKLSQEMMALYKANKANPMGGCLPMLLQIPIFISLYNVLLVSIEIKGAPFILWITDLSEKDPYYITPVLMGATMFIQQKISPPMGDPLQQKIMLLLPVVFTFLFLSFPAGLVVYWVVNNILTISQQWYIYKRVDAENAAKAITNPVFKDDKPVVDKSEKNNSDVIDQAPKKKADRKKGQGKKRR